MNAVLRSWPALIVLAAGPVAGAQQEAPAHAPVEAGYRAAAILLAAMGDPDADTGLVKQELAALGAPGIPGLLDIAAHSRAVFEVEGHRRFEIALREDLCALVIQTLAAKPREDLIPHLSALGVEPREPLGCAAALRVLEHV